jgi:hypothetical protein
VYGQDANPIRSLAIIDRIWEPPEQPLPDTCLGKTVSHRVRSNANQYPLKFVQELASQPDPTLLIPTVSVANFITRSRVEVQRQAQGWCSTLARTCSQVSAASGFELSSASRLSNSVRCSAVSRVGGRASSKLSQISRARAMRSAGGSRSMPSSFMLIAIGFVSARHLNASYSRFRITNGVGRSRHYATLESRHQPPSQAFSQQLAKSIRPYTPLSSLPAVRNWWPTARARRPPTMDILPRARASTPKQAQSREWGNPQDRVHWRNDSTWVQPRRVIRSGNFRVAALRSSACDLTEPTPRVVALPSVAKRVDSLRTNTSLASRPAVRNSRPTAGRHCSLTFRGANSAICDRSGGTYEFSVSRAIDMLSRRPSASRMTSLRLGRERLVA